MNQTTISGFKTPIQDESNSYMRSIGWERSLDSEADEKNTGKKGRLLDPLIKSRFSIAVLKDRANNLLNQTALSSP